jgi:hypothetical protein
VSIPADDRDTVLDLQAIFTRCFDQGNFTALIDYQRDPATTLSDEHRSQLPARVKHPRLDGVDRTTDDFGDLLIGIAVIVGQLDYGPLFRRKPRQLLLEAQIRLSLDQFGFRTVG